MIYRASKIAVLACLMLTFSLVSVMGQSDIVWSQTYGGEQDESFQDIFINSDNGAQVIGFGQSNVGTIKTGRGLYDMIICEMSANGDLNWTSSVGGSSNDLGKSILLNQGKTYIGGLTYSNDLDGQVNLGSGDILFGSLDDNDHTLEQSSLLGGNKLDNIVGVQLQQDGSIILVANTNSSDLAQSGLGGGIDIYICRLLPSGIVLWENTIGGNGVDKAADFKINSNGEIIIVGTTFSDNFLEFRKGIKDGFVLCLNSNGQQVWGKRYSNGNYSSFVACDLDRDENILLTGVQGNISTSDSGINGIYNEDIWVLQVSDGGQENWRHQFGGSDNDFATDIIAAQDGGMLVVGTTESYDGIVSGNYGNKDAFALKLNAAGNRLWSQKYGGSQDDLIEAVTQDRKGHYWLVGHTQSIDIDLSENNGGSDAWILKLEGEEPSFQIDLGAPRTVCRGESVTLDVAIDFCECQYLWSDGFIGAERTVTPASDMTLGLTVTDETGNVATDNIQIIVNQRPDYILVSTPPSCADTQDGEVSILLTESNAALTYQWNNGESQSALTGLGAGNYTLTLTDANGCTQVLSEEIVAPAPIVVASTTGAASCNSTSGQIFLDAIGGTRPFTYEWSNGNTEKNNADLAPGAYELTLTDANNCIVKESFTVENVDIDIEVEFDIVNNSCFDGGDGTIQILNIEDFSSFSWSTDSENAMVSDLSAGEYTLTYITADGCTGEQVFEISEPNPIEVTTNANNNLCFGDTNGNIGLELRGGTPPYTYNWSTGATTPFLTNLDAGAYSVTISDANGCSAMVEEEVLSPPALAVQGVLLTNESCLNANDGMISITVSGGFGDLEYTWSNGEKDPSIENLMVGRYSITVIDENGCLLIDEIAIENGGEFPVVAIDQQDPSCSEVSNGAIAFNADEELNYLWEDGAIDQEREDLSAGTYEVTISTEAGCSIVEQITLENGADFPVVAVDQQDPSCFEDSNGAIVFDSDEELSYLWEDGTADQEREDLPAGTYEVTISTEAGCSIVEQITLLEPSSLDVELEAQAVSCFGGQDAQLELTISGGTSPYTLESDGQDLQTQLAGNTALLDSLAAGVYNLDVVDDNGCIQSITTAIDEPEQIIIQGIVTDASCFGKADGAVEVIVSGGFGDISYAWASGFDTNIIEDITAADYLIEVTDGSGCTQERVFQIGQPEVLEVENTFSQPSNTNDDGSITLTVSGGTAPYEITWNNGDSGPRLSNLAGGSYQYTIRDANGCLLLGSIALETPINTSTNQFAPFDGVSLYPNPVDQLLQIKAAGNYRDVELSLYNTLGQIVYANRYSTLNNRGEAISMAQLAAGVYHVHLSNQEHQSTFKVVVNHP